MTLTEIRKEYDKLRKEAKQYIGKTFYMNGSVIGLDGDYLFKVDDVDIQENCVQVLLYMPEEGFEDENPWIIEWIPIKAVEENARWV